MNYTTIQRYINNIQKRTSSAINLNTKLCEIMQNATYSLLVTNISCKPTIRNTSEIMHYFIVLLLNNK